MIDYIVSQLPGLGVGGIVAWLVPKVWAKVAAAVERARG